MKKTLVLALVLALLRPTAALAWDPFVEDFDPGVSDPAPDPAPFVVPDGLYAVTDVYAGDVVTTSGNTTTYSTETVHETPGTYARVVDVVGSGSASAFDGSSFNGRASLPDGRAVGGTYYEDFVLTAGGFVSVNIVFFQDDSATRSAVAPTPAPPPPAPATPAPATPAPIPIWNPQPVVTARPAVTPVPAPASTPVPAPAPTPRSAPEPEPERVLVATAGVALAPTGPVLAGIEILRGRTVRLWPRAFVDGAAVPVRSWRLVGGAVDVLTRTAGGGSEPCEAAWLTPATTTLRFEITADAAPGRVLSAAVTVTVRSPALLQ